MLMTGWTQAFGVAPASDLPMGQLRQLLAPGAEQVAQEESHAGTHELGPGETDR